MSGFDPITQRCDSVYFYGLATPGLAVVEGGSGSPRKWQERGGYSCNGATIVFTGLGLAPFDVILKLYDKADWDAWNAFLPMLAPPKPGERARAIAVYHPFLKAYGIGEAVVKDISFPKVDDMGVTQIVIYCQAFRKPAPFVPLKPEGAKATPTDPVAVQLDANIALIAAQREALARR